MDGGVVGFKAGDGCLRMGRNSQTRGILIEDGDRRPLLCGLPFSSIEEEEANWLDRTKEESFWCSKKHEWWQSSSNKWFLNGVLLVLLEHFEAGHHEGFSLLFSWTCCVWEKHQCHFHCSYSQKKKKKSGALEIKDFWP